MSEEQEEPKVGEYAHKKGEVVLRPHEYDVILLNHAEDPTGILLIQRKNDPFAGMWAFPGGFIDEDASDADHVLLAGKDQAEDGHDEFMQQHRFGSDDAPLLVLRLRT